MLKTTIGILILFRKLYSLSISETEVGVREQHSDVERLKSVILSKEKDANFWKSMLKEKLIPFDGMMDISYNSIHHV